MEQFNLLNLIYPLSDPLTVYLEKCLKTKLLKKKEFLLKKDMLVKTSAL